MSERRPAISAANLVLERELRDVLTALGNAGVPVAVLKGIPMTWRLYGRLDGRTMVDIDVLVRRGDRRRAFLALQELGYDPESGLGVDVLDVMHEMTLSRSSYAHQWVTVDLHWAIALPELFPIDEDLVWGHVEPFEVRGLSCSVLDPEMTVVHLAAHVLQQRFRKRQIVVDLAAAWQLWSGELDLVALELLARRCGLWHALLVCLAIADSEGLLSRPRPALTTRARVVHRLVPQLRAPTDHYYDLRGDLLVRALARPRDVLATYRAEILPPEHLLAPLPGRNKTSKRAFRLWRAVVTRRSRRRD